MGDYNADAIPNLETARRIAFSYLIAPQTKLKIDQFSTVGPEKVFSFTRRIGSTRLQVLIDPTVF